MIKHVWQWKIINKNNLKYIFTKDNLYKVNTMIKNIKIIMNLLNLYGLIMQNI